MKQPHHLQRVMLACMLFLCLLISGVNAQTDTVRYRLLASILSDSSLFRYELGSIGIKTGSSVHYLKFQYDSAITTIGQWFRTTPFSLNGVSDTLSFVQFASFDDKNAPPPFQSEGFGTSSFDSAIAILKGRYIDTVFYVRPASSAFSSTSTVLYVVELRKQSDGSLISRLDTLACYADLSGKLVYGILPDTWPFSYSKHVVAGASADTNLYITVSRTAVLPSGASFLSDRWVIEATNPAAVDPSTVTDTAVLVPSSFRRHSPPSPIKSAVPNQSETAAGLQIDNLAQLRLRMTSPQACVASIRIYGLSGELVLENPVQLVSGDNLVLIDASHLSSGTYTVAVEERSKIIYHRMLIVTH